MVNRTNDNFIDLCLAGHALADDIDQFVDRWHDGQGPGMELHDFLGMSFDEYSLWVERPHALRSILYARRFHLPLDVAIENSAREHRAAARAGSEAEARELLQWLRDSGRA